MRYLIAALILMLAAPCYADYDGPLELVTKVVVCSAESPGGPFGCNYYYYDGWVGMPPFSIPIAGQSGRYINRKGRKYYFEDYGTRHFWVREINMLVESRRQRRPGRYLD